ncbi:MAG TPA: amidohydrolase family protein [Vicinamibacterales bacterium]|nr:amidohydrolase family protein [Vicinamibacterales bacterium]
MRLFTCAAVAVLASVSAASGPSAQGQTPAATAKAPVHARQVRRLLIQHAMVIVGNGTPAAGPFDILAEDGVISRIGNADAGWGDPDMVIDATGKYVMPGIVNTHMHWHEERVGPIPIQYERDLYLANGVTTAREVGGNFEKTKQWRSESAAHKIIAPRILLYPMLTDLVAADQTYRKTPDEIRKLVTSAKERGADGLKLIGPLDRDQAAAAISQAKAVGLPTTVHIAVAETTARDYVDLGVNCIEHFYGVGDAALDGIQDFPPEQNMANEIMRFGRAGELYTQDNFNPQKLSKLLDDMVAKGVAWSPTMSTYEANRDLIKNQNLPWYKDYLHPSLEDYYAPSMTRHGAYWVGWTNTQEVRWKKNYQVWMAAVREFGLKGGIIGTGDDAGYLYGSLYGFGITRELELHEEAGFHPLEVIRHATSDGAKILGLADKLGRIREGFIADLLVVNGNPVENLRVLNPYGIDVMTYDGKVVNNYSGFVQPGDPHVKLAHGGGIEWTIKDGIPYHVPTLMKEVKDMVAKARAQRK